MPKTQTMYTGKIMGLATAHYDSTFQTQKSAANKHRQPHVHEIKHERTENPTEQPYPNPNHGTLIATDIRIRGERRYEKLARTTNESSTTGIENSKYGIEKA